MMQTKLPKITFYKVRDNSVKVRYISNKVLEALKNEKRLLIAVPNLQAAEYVDKLLWRISPESFVPHVITDVTSSEWIVITLQQEHNVNQASLLINLCANATPLYQSVEAVYEFYDETASEKTSLSDKKMEFYREKGCQVVSE